jgi:hypothetical protein
METCKPLFGHGTTWVCLLHSKGMKDRKLAFPRTGGADLAGANDSDLIMPTFASPRDLELDNSAFIVLGTCSSFSAKASHIQNCVTYSATYQSRAV